MSDIVESDILNGWRTASGSHMMAVRFQLAKGWKTYWRAPGGSGIPPQFNWSRSKNVRGVRPIWPEPKLLALSGETTLGYTDELILPIEIFAMDPDSAITLSGTVDFGVCEDICVPVQSSLQATLTVDEVSDRRLIEDAIDKRVKPASRLGLRQATCEVDLTQDGYNITANLSFKHKPAKVHTVIEYQAADVWVDVAHTVVANKNASANAEMMSFRDTPTMFQRDLIRLTIFADGKSGEVLGCPAA